MKHLTENQLQELKELLEEEKKELSGHFELNNEGRDDGFEESQLISTGELSSYDNHPGDLGTETFERGRDLAVDEKLSARLDEVEDALARIGSGEYGTCEICGRSIPFERLQALPSATRCIDHVSNEPSANDRPVEEQVMTLPPKGAGENRQRNAGRFDDADAWKTVEEYGNASGTVKTETDT